MRTAALIAASASALSLALALLLPCEACEDPVVRAEPGGEIPVMDRAPAPVSGEHNLAIVRAKLSSPADELAGALRARLVAHVRPDGTEVLVAHCRRVRAPGGCIGRIRALAELLVDASARHRLDPWLLAALAVHETGLYPSAVNPASGTAGLLQLHPRGVGAHLEYVRSAAFRQACESRPDACQGPVIDAGAAHLAGWIQRCGDLLAGLGGYGAGRCVRSRVARDVLRERERLLALRRRPRPERVAPAPGHP